MIQVSEIHTIHYDVKGKYNGIPVLFLHGGPGVGCSDADLDFFDLNRYRIILIDQRGSGKSTPAGDMRENTTQNLIEDIEKIREVLKIDKWIVFGGSWGSTLAILYGIEYPGRCKSFVLRGIFLANSWAIKHMLEEMGNFHPEAFDNFLLEEDIPKKDNKKNNIPKEDILEHYYDLLMNSDPEIHQPAAERFMYLDTLCATVDRNEENIQGIYKNPKETLSIARSWFYYAYNGFFLYEEDYILKFAYVLRNIPCYIVHGRYDLICPVIGAYELKQKWGKNCSLYILENTGHSSREPETFRKLKSIMKRIN